MLCQRPRTRRVRRSSSATRSGWSRPRSRRGAGWRLDVVGLSELVRETTATFFDSLDTIELLDPRAGRLVPDPSPAAPAHPAVGRGDASRAPRCPSATPGLTVADGMLVDRLEYQRRAVVHALSRENLRPRILIADAVGLGKTLEIGMLLAELTRRGRADRMLVVTPRHVLEQMQHELWCRFGLPLVRLDSDGLQRVRQKLPATRNPFTYYRRIIVSIDTLKSPRYRAHLERHRWDVVVIDESHNLTNTGTLNNELARHARPEHRGADPGLGDPAQRQEGVVRRAAAPARPDRGRPGRRVRRR